MLTLHIGSIYSSDMQTATGRPAKNRVNWTIKVPGTNVSLLTAASKMPGAAWSLPAVKSCPGAKFGVGMICGTVKTDPKTHTCYATKGLHKMPHVRNAFAVRYAWVLACMATDAGFDSFVETLVSAILADGRQYFRIHESGDFFNARYVRAWIAIAQRLPQVQFWAPTRAYHGGLARTILPALAELNALPNVTVRPSALAISEDAPVVPGLSAGTGVKSDGFNCPASSQGNACRECRQCWDKTTPVYYHLH